MINNSVVVLFLFELYISYSFPLAIGGRPVGDGVDSVVSI